MTEILGKVATILADREVALNVGSDAGVKVGDRAVIMKSVTVTDPETNEELGTVDVPILGLYIQSVQPRFSVGSVNEVQDLPDQSLAAGILGRSSKAKRIVKSRSEEKPGMSVYVPVGARISIRKNKA